MSRPNFDLGKVAAAIEYLRALDEGGAFAGEAEEVSELIAFVSSLLNQKGGGGKVYNVQTTIVQNGENNRHIVNTGSMVINL